MRLKYAEAEPRYQRALDIYEKAYGTDDDAVAVVAGNLASVLRKLGRDGEADLYAQQAAKIREKNALAESEPTPG